MRIRITSYWIRSLKCYKSWNIFWYFFARTCIGKQLNSTWMDLYMYTSACSVGFKHWYLDALFERFIIQLETYCVMPYDIEHKAYFVFPWLKFLWLLCIWIQTQLLEIGLLLLVFVPSACKRHIICRCCSLETKK